MLAPSATAVQPPRSSASASFPVSSFCVAQPRNVHGAPQFGGWSDPARWRRFRRHCAVARHRRCTGDLYFDGSPGDILSGRVAGRSGCVAVFGESFSQVAASKKLKGIASCQFGLRFRFYFHPRLNALPLNRVAEFV